MSDVTPPGFVFYSGLFPEPYWSAWSQGLRAAESSDGTLRHSVGRREKLKKVAGRTWDSVESALV